MSSHWSYYNENDEYCAQWLENLIAAGYIADGIVDRRSIQEVSPEDVKEFTQCHFFAGIGGWSRAARLAGWPDDRLLWTGSCPCQPFSVAGKGKGIDDERHLWPDFFHLISSCRPPVAMGEQVAGAAGYGWLDGVRSCMEAEDYSCGAVDIPACAVNTPHRRSRLYWVADRMADTERDTRRQRWITDESREGNGTSAAGARDESGRRGNAGRLVQPIDARLERYSGDGHDRHQSGWEREEQDGSASKAGATSSMANSQYNGRRPDEQGRKAQGREVDGRVSQVAISRMANSGSERRQQDSGSTFSYEETDGRARWHELKSQGDYVFTGHGQGSNFWQDFSTVHCLDSKARRIEPGTFPLAHGVPARVGKLRAYGNAIVPEIAAEVIRSYMETRSASY